MGRHLVHYTPIVTTLLTVPFALEIWSRYRRHPDRLHLLWWALGIVTYGIGTLTESLTTLIGWREPKIITRFLILSIIFALLSLTTLKLR